MRSIGPCPMEAVVTATNNATAPIAAAPVPHNISKRFTETPEPLMRLTHRTLLVLFLCCAVFHLFAQSPVPQAEDLSKLDVSVIQQRAQAGDTAAEAELGFRYNGGTGGIRQDYAQSFLWTQRAAAGGNARAENNLAADYANAQGTAKDLTQALLWFQRSAAQGWAQGEANLGSMYQAGLGTAQNIPEAVHWYQLAAAQGNSDAVNALAQLALGAQPQATAAAPPVPQTTSPQNSDLAQATAETIRKGNALLAQANASSQPPAAPAQTSVQPPMESIDQDSIDGAAILAQAAQAQAAQAQAQAAQAQAQAQAAQAAAMATAPVQSAPLTQAQSDQLNQAVQLYQQSSFTQAFPTFLQLAQQGNATAERYLALSYQNGYGVATDYGQAIYWFQQASAQGDAWSESQLGFMYGTGQGVTLDYVRSMSWYQKAAAQGFPDAEYGVGYLYDNGDKVPVDHAKAVVYFQQAAAQGYAPAIQVLANLNGSTVNTQTAQASSPSSSDADQAHQDWQDKVDDLTQQLQQAQQDYNDDQALANNQKAQMQQETSSGGLLGALQGAISAVGDAGFQQRADQAKAQVASLRAQLAQLNAAEPAVNTSVSSFANGLIQQSNQPNLIQQTANQQEANILAAGNRQPTPQPYTAPQPTPAPQPAYQPAVGTPAVTPSTGCVPLTSQISVSSAWKTGLGSMPNEVVVTATNNAGVPVTCSFHYHKAGAWDAAHGEQIDLAPGQTLAGEAAGLWYMGADNSEVNYACFQKDSTTPTGSACSALPF